MEQRSFTLACILTLAWSASANNIQVTNVQLVGQNTTDHTYQVQFDLSWENSWRTSTLESNWDAAWVFIKCSRLDVDDWKHASLAMVGHLSPAGATLITAANNDQPTIGVGAFIYRSADGMGDVAYGSIQLRWNYGLNGFSDNDLVEVSVQAIEMVHVPQGAFYLGDASGDMYASFEAGTSNASFQVTSENVAFILGGGTAGSLGNNNRYGQVQGGTDDFYDAVSVTLPAAFPIGFDAFYAMKYEISQGQYAAFLTLLPDAQATARYPAAYNYSGYTIRANGSRYQADAGSRACNYLSWGDLTGYLDWSGLRPMSETEYEKLCRGTRYAVTGEYAWGNTRVQGIAYAPVYEVNSDSLVLSDLPSGLGHAYYVNVLTNFNGPLRCGIFAASSPSHTREECGASFYGAMELSGNVSELCVGVGRPLGRAFDGQHGNGALANDGNPDVANWPSPATASGCSSRGGGWNYNLPFLKTSYRVYGNADFYGRYQENGGRGVRTAP